MTKNRMEKSHKIMLLIAAVFVVVFVAVVINDHIQFQNHAEEIGGVLKDSAPAKMQAAWFTIMCVRFTEFMVPALCIGGAAIIMHIRENRKPPAKKKQNWD